MHNKSSRILIAISSTLFFFSYSMTPKIIIKSSDNHVYFLPRCKISISDSLVQSTLMQSKKVPFSSTPIISTSFDKQSLDLLFNAYDAGESFSTFFDALSDNEQTLLTSFAGEQESNSSLITARIAQYYDSAYEMTALIKPYMEMDTIVSFLYDKVVIANVSSPRNILKHANSSFKKNYHIPSCNTQNLMLVPLALQGKNIPFAGYAKNYLFSALFNNKQHIIYNKKERSDLSGLTVFYYIAQQIQNEKEITPAHKQRRILLTLNAAQDHLISEQPIVHPAEIVSTLFSEDGHYLASYSAASRGYLYYTVSLTELGTTQAFYPSIMLPINQLISSSCFHPQSNTFIAALKTDAHALITTWNPKTGQQLQALDALGDRVHILKCNKKGTRLFTVTRTLNSDTWALWDTTDCTAISCINQATVEDATIVQEPEFNDSKNILVIPTNRGTLLFMNSIDGTILCQQPQKPAYLNAITHIIFTPNDKLCITNTSLLGNRKKRDVTRLWKTKHGTPIGDLATKMTGTRGVGLSPNLQSVITVMNQLTMKKTVLFSDHIQGCLSWLKEHPSLVQMCALHHTHKAYKQKKRPSQEVLTILDTLPKFPCNVQQFIKTYLLYSPVDSRKAPKA